MPRQKQQSPETNQATELVIDELVDDQDINDTLEDGNEDVVDSLDELSIEENSFPVLQKPLEWYAKYTCKPCLDGSIMTLTAGERIDDLYLAWRLRNTGVELVNSVDEVN